jgi:hypothetical protein
MAVVLFIMGVVMAAVFLSLTTGVFSSSVSSAKADLRTEVRRAMDLVAQDVRLTYPHQIHDNNPSASHIKFKQVIGIYNTGPDAGEHQTKPDFVEYTFDSSNNTLTRKIVDDGGAVSSSLVFDNIVQPPFYTDIGVPLTAEGILNSRKLVIVIAGRSLVRGSLILNSSLTEEVMIRND